jgi:hypothetical protein
MQGDSWKQALVTFSIAGSLYGDYILNYTNIIERS